jgi:hypothetical protein
MDSNHLLCRILEPTKLTAVTGTIDTLHCLGRDACRPVTCFYSQLDNATGDFSDQYRVP